MTKKMMKISTKILNKPIAMKKIEMKNLEISSHTGQNC